jgi:S1-C subfamily serine protease
MTRNMLADSSFTNRFARDREAGARCPHCGGNISYGDEIAACLHCGSVHHVVCWHSHDGCGSYDCAPARRILSDNGQAALRVTVDEVTRVQPPPPRPVMMPNGCFPSGTSGDTPQRRSWSGLAIAAFVVALAGIPLFGIVTGLVAVLLGSLALGGIDHTRRRGTGLAVTGILLGLTDSVAWIVLLGWFFTSFAGRGQVAISLDDFEPNIESLNHMAPIIARSVRANALVESTMGSGILAGTAIGSGVIMQIENGSALIVTNRHVVDPNFTGREAGGEKPALPDGKLEVKLIGQMARPGHVVWMAPDGIDLALISVEVEGNEARAALWKPKSYSELKVGSVVFTIGNPEHLDWSYTRGSISQTRNLRRGLHQVHVIQTDAALNHGNSGGGLYDSDSGKLIGINTWTNDKTVSEGIGFAISLDELLELKPPGLRVADEPPPKGP